MYYGGLEVPQNIRLICPDQKDKLAISAAGVCSFIQLDCLRAPSCPEAFPICTRDCDCENCTCCPASCSTESSKTIVNSKPPLPQLRIDMQSKSGDLHLHDSTPELISGALFLGANHCQLFRTPKDLHRIYIHGTLQLLPGLFCIRSVTN